MTLTNDRPELSSERVLHMDRTETLKQEETSGHEPQTGLDTKTDRLTVSRNVTLTLSLGGSCSLPLFLMISCFAYASALKEEGIDSSETSSLLLLVGGGGKKRKVKLSLYRAMEAHRVVRR
jgi:hypothetical protein